MERKSRRPGEGAGFDVPLARGPSKPTPSPHKSQRDQATRQARWQAANPQAVWAWQCLRTALRRGLIQRLPCEVCGAEPTDAHHENYHEPMRVKFLCRKHHRALHMRERSNG